MRRPGQGLCRSRLRKSAKSDGDPCRGRNVASAGTGGLGRRGSAHEARSLEPRRRPCSSPDRKGLRHVETLLRPSTHALAGAREGRSASAANGHRLQSISPEHATSSKNERPDGRIAPKWAAGRKHAPRSVGRCPLSAESAHPDPLKMAQSTRIARHAQVS